MAGNLPVPQGVEMKLVWSLNNVLHAFNILHGTHAIGTVHTQGRADTIDSICKAAFTSSGLVGQVHTTYRLVQVQSRHMDSNEDPWFVPSAAAVVGTGTGDLLPPATAYCVTLPTAKRGRSFKGRVYLTGYTEGANDPAGAVATAAAGPSNLFIQTIQTQLQSQLQIVLSVLSRWTTLPGLPPNTPPVERNPPLMTPVTTPTNLDLRWDTQRRRAIPGI